MSTVVSLLNVTDSYVFVSALCLVGVGACLYAVDIEKSGKKPKYKRMCDVSESMSCTLVLTSKYGHMAKLLFKLDEKSIFNMSNAQYGLIFYLGLFFFQFYPFTVLPYHSVLFLTATLSSVMASLGLAWILYYVLHNFCMICVCMYVINTLLFVSALVHMNN